MEKLFYIDSYIKNFTAEIEEIKEMNNKYHVLLDKTAFFPGGGGQYCDLGTIDNMSVEDVYEENDKIYHVLDKKPNRIHKVKCEIDWDRREYGMQHHFGQHVISACFNNEYKAKTVGFHLGKDFATVDIEGFFKEDDIIKIESMCNEIIRENIPVEFLNINKKEAKKLKIKDDLSKLSNDIRVVKFGDLDINLCCGVHVKNTLDLRVIKIKKFEKYKKATRIEFLCGTKAIDEMLKRDNYLNKICKMLSSNEEGAYQGIEKLNNKINEANKENRKLEEIISNYEMKEMIEEAEKNGSMNIIIKTYEDKNMNYINKIANKITETENNIGLFALINNDRLNLLFACSKNLEKIDMNILLKDSIKLVDGKGGGSKTLAQGGGKNNGNLDSLFDYVKIKIKST
ncbi:MULTISPECIES: DHHA1 domain-containing protein [Terrisporobacter]|uniref:Alanine--tRNA ligase n=2 Tax=Terrisporobacter TaxID=1505652 RepID=A0A9X2S5C6_9FIRM|nr:MULTISPECIES: DHHA1 domain-containing protein [Terrisporobacter]MCC3669476.1 DHHA1 domain-containing protein [Terrisporobacter mayombei]MCR1824491.1 DHHA1 domain-containing protein [Terrisporobacter muris]MDU6983493.1 DHHA1 domain-containing protein [Terrisporobacter othiniensis]MDY3374595.1 DHHA1 domain-containing protein [Terrisporobacter othiniensis]